MGQLISELWLKHYKDKSQHVDPTPSVNARTKTENLFRVALYVGLPVRGTQRFLEMAAISRLNPTNIYVSLGCLQLKVHDFLNLVLNHAR